MCNSPLKERRTLCCMVLLSNSQTWISKWELVHTFMTNGTGVERSMLCEMSPFWEMAEASTQNVVFSEASKRFSCVTCGLIRLNISWELFQWNGWSQLKFWISIVYFFLHWVTFFLLIAFLIICSSFATPFLTFRKSDKTNSSKAISQSRAFWFVCSK